MKTPIVVQIEVDFDKKSATVNAATAAGLAHTLKTIYLPFFHGHTTFKMVFDDN